MPDFFPGYHTVVNPRPITPQGGNVLLSSRTVAGPDQDGDRRVYFPAQVLRRLLELAESSPTQTAMMTRAGVRIETWKDANGHVFEVWHFVGVDPKPERFLGML